MHGIDCIAFALHPPYPKPAASITHPPPPAAPPPDRCDEAKPPFHDSKQHAPTVKERNRKKKGRPRSKELPDLQTPPEQIGTSHLITSRRRFVSPHPGSARPGQAQAGWPPAAGCGRPDTRKAVLGPRSPGRVWSGWGGCGDWGVIGWIRGGAAGLDREWGTR